MNKSYLMVVSFTCLFSQQLGLQAAFVQDNPNLNNPGILSDKNEPEPATQGQEVVDNFTGVSYIAGQEWLKLTFWGKVLDSNAVGDRFHVRIFNDVAGVPEQIPFWAIGLNETEFTSFNEGVGSDGRSLIRYEAYLRNLPPVLANPSAESEIYWFAVTEKDNSTGLTWNWATAPDQLTGEDYFRDVANANGPWT